MAHSVWHMASDVLSICVISIAHWYIYMFVSQKMVLVVGSVVTGCVPMKSRFVCAHTAKHIVNNDICYIWFYLFGIGLRNTNHHCVFDRVVYHCVWEATHGNATLIRSLDSEHLYLIVYSFDPHHVRHRFIILYVM